MQPQPSAENWIIALLSKALPTRARPSFSYHQSFPSGSLHKHLSFLHQGADRRTKQKHSPTETKTQATLQKVQFSSVQFSCSVVSDSLQPHELQHARLPCPSSTPGAFLKSCPSSWWCYLTISSSVVPFSSFLQSFPASESFPVSQFFSSGGQSIGVSASASVLPINIQDWFPLGLAGLIFL